MAGAAHDWQRSHRQRPDHIAPLHGQTEVKEKRRVEAGHAQDFLLNSSVIIEEWWGGAREAQHVVILCRSLWEQQTKARKVLLTVKMESEDLHTCRRTQMGSSMLEDNILPKTL